ncbi:MAG: DNA polymerase III [Planctomycetaceae bacterium]|nr:DNA polymerase III [Planctomycetaceae bacterium]
MDMLNIPGLGPKGVATVWKQGGVETIDDLKQKIDNGELTDLPRMGEKTLAKIRKAIDFTQKSSQRILLGEAVHLAHSVIEHLRAAGGIRKINHAGSLRRGRETIGDIDILACCDDPQHIAHAFRGMPMVDHVLFSGVTKNSVMIDGGVQIDLRIVPEESYGAALMYFTGSKEHNIVLRERAIKQGMRLNEWGLWRGDDESDDNAQPLAGATESEVYEALGLPLIEPPLREHRGEFEAAGRDALPKLVRTKDIKSELHAHTTASDGLMSIDQLAEVASRHGFHTIAVTDHSSLTGVAHGLDAKRLAKHAKAVRKANEQTDGITILAGAEVDILADGSLDYPDDVLAELDIVVASPHVALTLDPAKSTTRLIRAVENPYVHILGHPTGRAMRMREGMSPDIHQLVEAAARTGTALEINANQVRLDLRDTHARAAIEAGAMLAINTDAHRINDFDNLRFGVMTARRAWAEPKHVVNCLTPAKLTKWLAAKRKLHGV